MAAGGLRRPASNLIRRSRQRSDGSRGRPGHRVQKAHPGGHRMFSVPATPRPEPAFRAPSGRADAIDASEYRTFAVERVSARRSRPEPAFRAPSGRADAIAASEYRTFAVERVSARRSAPRAGVRHALDICRRTTHRVPSSTFTVRSRAAWGAASPLLRTQLSAERIDHRWTCRLRTTAADRDGAQWGGHQWPRGASPGHRCGLFVVGEFVRWLHRWSSLNSRAFAGGG